MKKLDNKMQICNTFVNVFQKNPQLYIGKELCEKLEQIERIIREKYAFNLYFHALNMVCRENCDEIDLMLYTMFSEFEEIAAVEGYDNITKLQLSKSTRSNTRKVREVILEEVEVDATVGVAI